MRWKHAGLVGAVAVVCYGCATQEEVARLHMDVSQMREEVTAMGSRVDGMRVEADACKAYFKDVKDYMETTRGDVVRLMDTNRRMIVAGRGEYLRVLTQQKAELEAMLKAVGEAMAEFEKLPPEAEKELGINEMPRAKGGLEAPTPAAPAAAPPATAPAATAP